MATTMYDQIVAELTKRGPMTKKQIADKFEFTRPESPQVYHTLQNMRRRRLIEYDSKRRVWQLASQMSEARLPTHMQLREIVHMTEDLDNLTSGDFKKKYGITRHSARRIKNKWLNGD